MNSLHTKPNSLPQYVSKDEPMDSPSQHGKQTDSNRYAVSLMLLSLLLLIPPALYNPMASFDEAWYASVARNVVATGDWLTFHYNGEPFWEKPPVGLWMIAASFRLFGISDFAARIPAIVCGIVCVLVAYRFGTRHGGVRVGALAALILISAQDFVRFAAKGQLDVPLTLLVTAQILFFWNGLDRPRLQLASGLFLGLAIATKNQAGIIGAIVEAAYILLARDWRALRQWQWYAGRTFGLLTPAIWFLHQYAVHGQAFLDRYYFINYGMYLENADKAQAGGGIDRWAHLRYLATRHNVLFACALGGLAFGLVRFWRRSDRLLLLLSIWVVLVPSLFTWYGAPHYWYLMPMYPAVALLAAAAISHSHLWSRRPHAVLAAVAAWAVVFQASYYLPPPRDSILWATKRLATAVQERVAPGEPIVLLSSADRNNHQTVYKPGAHYYFNRIARALSSPTELRTQLDRTPRVLAVVDEQVFDGEYSVALLDCDTTIVAKHEPLVVVELTRAPGVLQSKGPAMSVLK